MVATRRTAQPDADPPTSTMLSKKPIRKPKSAAAAKPAPETKTRTTRGKKPEVEDVEDVRVPEEEPTKTTRKAAGRPKKAATSTVAEDVAPSKTTRATRTKNSETDATATSQETSQQSTVKVKPTRSAAAGSVRGRKATAAAATEPPAAVPEDAAPAKANKSGTIRGRKAATVTDAPALPVPQPKASRATRATAAKVQPLSPKKITQVSKPTRTTRAANHKSAKSTQTATQPVRGGTTSRKRKVSDENAEILELHHDLLDSEDEDVVLLSSTPKHLRSKLVETQQPVTRAESEASMSSGPTTPNDSGLQSFSNHEDDEEEKDEQDDDSVSEGEDADMMNHNAVDAEASEDELCGPKTPMKRASPGAGARYLSSVQRTIRKYEDQQRMQTPADRPGLSNMRRGTPQTLKPAPRPLPPSSERRPMTVARGAGRAFVFRDLHEGAPDLPEQEEDAAGHEDPVVQDELSFIPDDDIIPLDSFEEMGNNVDIAEAATPTPVATMMDDSLSDDESKEHGAAPASSVAMETFEDEEGYVAPAELDQDPNETIFVADEDGDDESEAASEQAGSFEGEDTVIVTRPVNRDVEDLEPAETVSMPSPAPSVGDDIMQDDREDDSELISQTDEQAAEQDEEISESEMDDDESVIIHNLDMTYEVQNIQATQSFRREGTITCNFDSLFDGAREAAIASVYGESMTAGQSEHVAALAGTEMNLELTPTIPKAPSRRVTVNFNEFFDITGLAEPTGTLRLSLGQQVEQESTDDVVKEAAESKPAGVEALAADAVSHVVQEDSAASKYFTGEQQVDAAQPAQGGTEQECAAAEELEMLDVGDTSGQEEQPQVEQANDLAVAEFDMTPHYALPTIAFRRKSLPASIHRTPLKTAIRPHTSDGASIARVANPFTEAWWSRSRANSTATTPIKVRPSTSCATRIASTPVKTPLATPKERFPRLPARQDYEQHARTVAAPARFQTPAEKSPKRRETFHRAATGRVVTSTPKPPPSVPDIPQAAETPMGMSGERFPRLSPRKTYTDHAKTVAAPVRFQTPTKTPPRRPATTKKPETLRKAALRSATSRTPIKTPLKAPAMTPGQVPMTPHPFAPLRGVVALVEVFTLEGASASAPFIALLNRLGAKSTKAWCDRVTHVIFKDGSPTTLQRVRLHNKSVAEKESGMLIHCVNSRWITDCDTNGTRMDETDEAYAIDVAEIPRGGKRRRKSMEPSALVNVGGNIVRDRSSIGRKSSLGRSAMKMLAQQPPVEATPAKTLAFEGKENSSSPETPAWIAAPDQLVQQTAPMNRVRKLDLPGKEGAKSRRLTFWNGGA